MLPEVKHGLLKYADTEVTFAEIPDEVTLCISISNCIFRCKGCHSPHLAKDIGEELDNTELKRLIESNSGISCVCIMGGDIDPSQVNDIAAHIKRNYPELKTAWYSGADELTLFTDISNFDYIKTGRYDRKLGPLTSPTTNQRFYKVSDGKLVDSTIIFRK